MVFIYTINFEKIKQNILSLSKNDYIVLKSNAYGFGFEEILQLALSIGMHKFALIDINECIYIKNYYPHTTVLLLGRVNEKILVLCEKYQIEVTITDLDDIKLLSKYRINVQIEINSGMNRFGIRNSQMNTILTLLKDTNLTPTGIYSHNATNNPKYIDNQIACFYEVVRGKKDLDIHFQSSSLKDLNLEFITAKRIGAAIYKDALKVSGRIIKINYCLKDEYIGYDYNYQFSKDSYVGVIDIGYADGLDRNCSGFLVYINGKYYPLIGKACMNNSFVLLEDNSNLNEEVIFIGEENNIANYEKHFHKISHEIYLSCLKK